MTAFDIRIPLPNITPRFLYELSSLRGMEYQPDIAALIAELTRRGVVLPEGRVRVDEYGDSPELEAELLALIRSGRKRGSAALVWSYEAEGLSLPRAGDIEIVVNSLGAPQLITRILSVDVVPFSEVNEAHAELEGEGNLSLNHWRQTHWEFFKRECAQIECEPSEEMPVVCVRFELLNVLS